MATWEAPLPAVGVPNTAMHHGMHANIRASLIEIRETIDESIPVGSIPVFIQETNPVVTGPALWYVLDGAGNVIDIRIQLV